MSDVERLRTDIRTLGDEINTIAHTAGTKAPDRRDMEGRVIALCEAASSLPAAEARSLAADLNTLIEALNAAEARLRASGVTADSPAPRPSAHAAAAAYGATAAARRRGS
ncbi:MAG: hypothetical protein HQ481_16300 [Alphaproteobacteria bacterium]|nr:hypothetical protein [Alphaproteobacteria bacterium]